MHFFSDAQRSHDEGLEVRREGDEVVLEVQRVDWRYTLVLDAADQAALRAVLPMPMADTALLADRLQRIDAALGELQATMSQLVRIVAPEGRHG